MGLTFFQSRIMPLNTQITLFSDKAIIFRLQKQHFVESTLNENLHKFHFQSCGQFQRDLLHCASKCLSHILKDTSHVFVI